MTNHEIVERFLLVEQEAREPRSYIEAARIGDNIVFRLSKRAARTVSIVQNVWFAGCGLVLSPLTWGLFSPPLPLLASVCLWSITLCLWAVLLWMAIQTRATQKEQPKFFEIDLERACLIVHRTGSAGQSLEISKIYCFYAWHTIVGSDHHSAIYAVDKNDQTVVLMAQEIEDKVTERNARLLGFLFNKPVFKRDVHGEITPLPDFTAAHGS